MQEWIENGCQLAWLINPEEGITYQFYQNTIITSPLAETISGRDVLQGFTINIASL
jgi:hypothetical protein